MSRREKLLTLALLVSVALSASAWLGRAAEAQSSPCGRFQVITGTHHPPVGVSSALIIKVDTATGQAWHISYQEGAGVQYKWTPIP
jgi:hypothetical protein